VAALEDFNQQPADQAVQALRTCHAAPRFAAEVVAARPYADVEQLVARAASSGAVAVDGDGRDQPLLAAYDTAALRRALPAAPHGASMRLLLAGLPDVLRVPLRGTPPPWFGCDTAQDRDAARRHVPEPG
jgi:hypothetical protein